MNTLTIDGVEHKINDEVANLVILISKERDELKQNLKAKISELKTAEPKFRGHDIERIDGKWYFCASGNLVEETHKGMPCGHCGKADTRDGHDGCLGALPGLMNACCGHGADNETYVQFLDGVIVSGVSAKIIIGELKKYND